MRIQAQRRSCDRRWTSNCLNRHRRSSPNPGTWRPRVRALYWGSAAAASPRHHRGQRSELAPEMPRVTPRVRVDGNVWGRPSRLFYATRGSALKSGLDLNPLERARTELELAPGFLVRSAPKPRRVVDRVGA